MPENIAVGSEFELSMSRNLELQDEHPMDVLNKINGSEKNSLLEKASGNFSKETDRGRLDLFSVIPSNKTLNETASLTGIIWNTDSQTETTNRISSVSDMNNMRSNEAEDLPSLELSLKRLRAVKDIGVAAKDDRKVLRRSDSSAFSRYFSIGEMVLFCKVVGR